MMIASKELSAQRMEIAFSFAKSFALVDVVGSFFGGIVAGIAATSLTIFAVTTFLGLVAGALAVAVVLLEAISAANAMLDNEANENIEQSKAQRQAIDRATGAQLNVNAGPGQMTVKNKATVYRVNGQVVQIGEHLTANQIAQAEPRRIEIPAADVRWFCEQIANGYGHSKSRWVIAKVELPFSRLPVDWTIYKALVDPLAEGGAIVGRGERSAGRLVTTDPAQLVKVIEAKHPDAGSRGIVLELPAEASAA